MSEVADLQEFNGIVANEEVASGISESRPRGPRRVHRGDDAIAMDSTKVDGQESQVNPQMWAVYGNNVFSACEKAVGTLPPAQYTIENHDQLGLIFRQSSINLDELIHLPDSVSDNVVKDIEAFWTKEEHFRKFGFLWKRGVLLWGPPGSGKTSTLQVISSRIIERGGLSVYVDHPGRAARGLKLMRSVEPNRPIVVMLEDLDTIIEMYGESDLLALMDGELQIDNVVFVATTNYPERLDKRLINRPSRFDIVRKIGMPGVDARRTYLQTKNDRLQDQTEELEEWVELTNDFSIAHLKELIVSVEVFEVPLADAVGRLKTMMATSPKSNDRDGSGNVGFGFVR